MRLRSPSVTTKPIFASKLDPVNEQLAALLAKMKPIGHDSTASGIVLPETRSHKQRNFAYCNNPECAEAGLEFRFEIEQTLVPCPKCGATKAPMVGMLAKTHLLVRDRKGKLAGIGGLTYRLACDTENKRDSISSIHNHELGTGDRTIANCIDCLVQADRQNVGLVTGHTLQFAK